MPPRFACVIHPCGIAAADFAPKNSPPDCFLHGAHPLRVRIPTPKNKNTDLSVGALFLAQREGFEPSDGF